MTFKREVETITYFHVVSWSDKGRKRTDKQISLDAAEKAFWELQGKPETSYLVLKKVVATVFDVYDRPNGRIVDRERKKDVTKLRMWRAA